MEDSSSIRTRHVTGQDEEPRTQVPMVKTPADLAEIAIFHEKLTEEQEAALLTDPAL